MAAILPLLAVGTALYLLMHKDHGQAAAAAKADADRIVQESKEIIQGKRTSYSHDPNTPVSKDVAVQTAKQAVAAADAAALRAAQQAANAKTTTTPPKPKPVVQVTPKPPPKPQPHAQTHAAPPKPQPHKAPPPKPQPHAATPPPPKPAGPPPGYNKATAQKTAAAIAKDLRTKGRDHYNRTALKVWQKNAGIAPDGLYGHGTHAALKYFKANPPPVFFNQGVEVYPWA